MHDACAQEMVKVQNVVVKLLKSAAPVVDAAICRSMCRAEIHVKAQLQIQGDDGTCCIAVSISVSSNKQARCCRWACRNTALPNQPHTGKPPTEPEISVCLSWSSKVWDGRQCTSLQLFAAWHVMHLLSCYRAIGALTQSTFSYRPAVAI